MKIPRKLHIGDVWLNLKKSTMPDRKGLEYGTVPGGGLGGLPETAGEEDTLLGRLAKRMTSRDIIDSLDLGTRSKSSNAQKAAVADMGIPRALRL